MTRQSFLKTAILAAVMLTHPRLLHSQTADNPNRATGTIDGVKIKSVEWLDPSGNVITDPNDHPSGKVGVRWFPGATKPDGPWNDQIQVRVKIDPPTPGVQVFLRIFDVDDPSADDNVVDKDKVAPDNRKETYESSANGIVKTFKATTTQKTPQAATFPFRVSHQPGNNYRAVASLTSDALNFLQVTKDTKPHFIPPDDSQVKPEDAILTSKLLTIWRKLFVEVDSMGQVKDNDATGNIIAIHQKGYALKVDPVGLKMNGVTVNNLDDGSEGRGRFERGRVVSLGGVKTKSNVHSNVRYNTKDSLHLDHKVNIPFEILNPTTIKRGRLTRLFRYGSCSALFAENIQMRPHEFKDGTIIIDETSYLVKDNTEHTVDTKEVVKLPFNVLDDDSIKPGEDVPMPNTDKLTEGMAPAYVFPVLPGEPGAVGDSNDSLPFYANQEDITPVDWDSESYLHDNFWVVYVMGFYQPEAARDIDPDSEMLKGYLGVTGQACIIYMELHNESAANMRRLIQQDTVLHEIMHKFGYYHDEPYNHPPATDSKANLTPFGIWLLREARIPTNNVTPAPPGI